jgi:hypothetical protein
MKEPIKNWLFYRQLCDFDKKLGDIAMYQNWFSDLLTTMVMKFPKNEPQFTVTTTPGEHSSKCLQNENYNIQGCNLSL